MANSRIKDLSGEVAVGEIQALLATLYLATDDTSFTDAEKILLSTILSSAIVTDNSINYQALTPKGFYESLATEARKGIVKLATNTEILNKTAGAVLTTDQLSALQALFKNDWFFGNGTVKKWTGTSSNLATTKTLQYVVNWEGDLNTGDIVQLVPDGWVASGARFKGVYAQLSCEPKTGLTVAGQSLTLNASGVSNVLVAIVTSGYVSLVLTPNGALFGLYCNLTTTGVKISMNVNAILV